MKPKTPPSMLRYLTRLRSLDLVPMSAFIPRQLNQQVAQAARQHRTSHGVIIESALLDGLRLLRPSTIAMAQRRRRSGGEPATPSALSMRKNGDAGA